MAKACLLIALAGLLLLPPCDRRPHPAHKCIPAPPALASHLSDGTVDEDERLTDVYVVGNNDDGAYRFIAARFHMPELPWQVLTWATPSEDLDDSARINAVDAITRIFSIWDKPLEGTRDFDPKYHDDIRAAWKCVDAPFASATPGRFLLAIVIAAPLLLFLAHTFSNWDRPLERRRDFDLKYHDDIPAAWRWVE